MSYENDYEALLVALKKIDNHARHLMKGLYRRESENYQLRKVIANLLHSSKTLSERERDELMNALRHDPRRKVKDDFEDLRSAVKSKLGNRTIVGEP